MEAKYTVRRLIASVLLSPVVALAYGMVWFIPVMFGAYGTLAMYLTALPYVLITWVVCATLAPQLMRLAEWITRP